MASCQSTLCLKSLLKVAKTFQEQVQHSGTSHNRTGISKEQKTADSYARVVNFFCGTVCVAACSMKFRKEKRKLFVASNGDSRTDGYRLFSLEAYHNDLCSDIFKLDYDDILYAHYLRTFAKRFVNNKEYTYTVYGYRGIQKYKFIIFKTSDR